MKIKKLHFSFLSFLLFSLLAIGQVRTRSNRPKSVIKSVPTKDKTKVAEAYSYLLVTTDTDIKISVNFEKKIKINANEGAKVPVEKGENVIKVTPLDGGDYGYTETKSINTIKRSTYEIKLIEERKPFEHDQYILSIKNPINKFTDIRDGQIYETIEIGNVTIMAENLNYKINGSSAYNNDDSYRSNYGLLYTWESAKKACPKGWRLPMKQDLEKIINTLTFDDNKNVAFALKSTSSEWKDKNLNSKNPNIKKLNFRRTNGSGFNGLPSGQWEQRYGFTKLGIQGSWWTSSIKKNKDIEPVYLNDTKVNIYYGLRKLSTNARLSCRCVKE